MKSYTHSSLERTTLFVSYTSRETLYSKHPILKQRQSSNILIYLYQILALMNQWVSWKRLQTPWLNPHDPEEVQQPARKDNKANYTKELITSSYQIQPLGKSNTLTKFNTLIKPKNSSLVLTKFNTFIES